jgi:hypothetical protein
MLIKYLVMCRDQNAGGSRNVKVDNSTFERVKQFEYSVTAFSNQNYFQEEIRNMLISGSNCYYSVQNLLSSILLSKNIRNYSFACCMGVKLGRSH